MERDGDPDDWFGEGAEGQAKPAEDWLVPADEREPGRPWWEHIDRRMVVVAVIALALLIAVLAAAGVFSGGGSSDNAAVTTAPTTTAGATVETTTAPAPKPSTPAPTTTLKPGDSGAQVKVLQQALTALGYSPGTIDGQYGDATAAAVKEFQTAEGLDADGVLGPKTLAALATKLRSA